jgi:general secretion pathway protein C
MELVLQRYSWAMTAFAAVIAAFLAARTVNTLVAGAIAPKPALVQQAGAAAPLSTQAPQHVELEQDKLARLLDVPIPKPASAGPVDTPPEPPKPSWEAVPVRSALHGTLVGTAIANPERYSLCQITNPDLNETQVYGIGEKYQGARIYAVERERVLVANNGRNEYIDNSAAAPPNLGITPMPGPPQAAGGGGDGVKQLSENQYVVAKSEINNALTNLSDLATKARIVPSFKNGVANGFKLFSIVPDSLYSKIGVQNGDVIRKINGYEMNSPDKALEIYQKLRDANRIEIELERRGESVRKSYSIE